MKVKIPITIGDIPIRFEDENLVIQPSAPPLEPLSDIVSEFLSALPSAPPLENFMDDLRTINVLLIILKLIDFYYFTAPTYEEAMRAIHS